MKIEGSRTSCHLSCEPTLISFQLFSSFISSFMVQLALKVWLIEDAMMLKTLLFVMLIGSILHCLSVKFTFIAHISAGSHETNPRDTPSPNVPETSVPNRYLFKLKICLRPTNFMLRIVVLLKTVSIGITLLYE